MMTTGSSPASWYALYTRSRHEKFIESELKKKQIESFLPLRKIKRRWSDRTVTIEEPLFKSYLFVKTDFTGGREILKTKGAVRLISFGGRPFPIDEEIIRSIKLVVQNDIAADPFPYLDTGDRVCVKSGLFKGVEGFIVRKDNRRCRVVVSIMAIMAAISVEVDSWLVEKV